MSVGEEYHVVKRGREYHGCGEEYNVKKREKRSNSNFPLKLRLLGRISSGKEGKEMEILRKKIKIFKNMETGENIML